MSNELSYSESGKLNFNIYTFQFNPIVDYSSVKYPHSLFDSAFLEEQQKVMKVKNEIFKNILDLSKYHWKNKELKTKKIFEQDDLFVFKLSRSKNIKVEKDFRQEITETQPSIYIIIYNNSEYQKIAIQECRNVFVDTDIAARILENSFVEKLKSYNLNITIRKAYRRNEFWDFIEQHKEKICMVKFEFNYPNLPSLRAKFSEAMKETAKSISSDNVNAIFKSTNQTLVINKDNETICNLNDVSAEAGNPITIKVKGSKKYHKTGETFIIKEIDELQIQSRDTTFIRKILEDLNDD